MSTLTAVLPLAETDLVNRSRPAGSWSSPRCSGSR